MTTQKLIPFLLYCFGDTLKIIEITTKGLACTRNETKIEGMFDNHLFFLYGRMNIEICCCIDLNILKTQNQLKNSVCMLEKCRLWLFWCTYAVIRVSTVDGGIHSAQSCTFYTNDFIPSSGNELNAEPFSIRG